VSEYLYIGLVFYLIMAFIRFRTLIEADLTSILKGLFFGIVLWPFAVLFVAYQFLMERPHDKERR
jgi:hypothetical protein